jgi:glutathione S-transferase
MKAALALAALVSVSLAGCVSVSSREYVAPASAARAVTPMPPITIYHLEGRRSERVVWLMEELGFPYELKFVNNSLGASLAEIRKVNPKMPTAPTVIYEDQVLMESGAIIDVILRRHTDGKLMPALDSKDYPWHQIWYQYAEGSLLPRVGTDYRVWQIQPADRRSPLVDSENVIRFADDWLATHPYFGGAEFTSADIMMEFALRYTLLLNIVDKEKFPNILGWLERMHARPAYQRMVAKARPNGMIGPPVPLPDEARPPARTNP